MTHRELPSSFEQDERCLALESSWLTDKDGEDDPDGTGTKHVAERGGHRD